MTILAILLGVAVVLLITAVTGYFVAQEFAFMAVDRSRLTAEAAAGDRAAARTLEVTRRTSFMLSGAQLGITVTGLLVGYVAEPLIGSGLGDLLHAGLSRAASAAIGAVLAVLFSTLVQMLFGELVPKNIAIARSTSVAKALAWSTTLYLRAFGWLISFFDRASNRLLSTVGIEPVHDVEQAVTARDLEHIVARSQSSGDLPVELSRVLDRVLDFPSRPAAHAMTPRARAATVRTDEPLRTVLDRMSHQHTRYPVVGATVDDPRGVIDLRDLLALDDAELDAPAGTRMRTPVLLPTSAPLTDVVVELRAAGQEMALLVDEYGGLAGLITLEDVTEELLGELEDEHDDAVEPIQALTDGWEVLGRTSIDEVGRAIGADLPTGVYDTVSGLIMHELSRMATVGDEVSIRLSDGRRLLARVDSVERRVPGAVHLAVTEGADDE